jgi:hypothetical protein
LSSDFFCWFSFPIVSWLTSSSLASSNCGSIAAAAFAALAAATEAARNCLHNGRWVDDAGRGNDGLYISFDDEGWVGGL